MTAVPFTRGSVCAKCGTQLPPHALACPACKALTNSEKLKELAATADQQATAGQLIEARDSWQRALDLLPPDSQQHSVIRERMSELTKRIDKESVTKIAHPEGTPWWKRGAVGIGALIVLLLTKGKFLLLGLTKAKTFFSMFAFFGVYWSMYGWPLALGLVVSIYIHEMGHVSELRRLGIGAGAPLFIPGVGAFVMLRSHITDPIVDARIGLAGPIWGLGAGIAAYAVWLVTRIDVWGAIAALTGFINLFNLTPIWQLDGSRGFHALSRIQRWAIVAVIALAFVLTQQKLLIIVGAVAVFRAFQKAVVGAGDQRTLVTFALLVAALSWLSTAHRSVIGSGL